MTSPDTLAAGLRAHARGLYCLQAAAELLISQDWLHRPEFTRFITVHRPGRQRPGACCHRLACRHRRT